MIYDNIFERAKKRGISINKLEEQAELSKGSICKWGKSVSPTVKSIKKVADILGYRRRKVLIGREYNSSIKSAF